MDRHETLRDAAIATIPDATLSHQWEQIGGARGYTPLAGGYGRSVTCWTERCTVCLQTRQMQIHPAGEPYEPAWVQTDPVCTGPAPEHVRIITAWEDGEVSDEECWGYKPRTPCQATTKRGRPCRGDMTYRRGQTYCAGHEHLATA